MVAMMCRRQARGLGGGGLAGGGGGEAGRV